MTAWTLSLGRWAGVPVRGHAVTALTFALLAGTSDPRASARGVLLGAAVCALAHAAAVLWAARRTGRAVQAATLLPWGAHLQTSITGAGPGSGLFRALFPGLAVRLVLAMLCHAAAGVAARAEAWPALYTWTRLYHWNLLLAWMNLVPAFPLDAGQALSGTLRFWLPDELGRPLRRKLGRGTAIALGVWSCWPPLHLPAAFMALLLFDIARRPARTAKADTSSASSGVLDARGGVNPDDITVSPPPYARAHSRATAAARGFTPRAWLRSLWADLE
jgi:Zn-dependent protease